MSDTSANIIVLADYVKARKFLSLNNIQDILNEQHTKLLGLEDEVIDLTLRTHKLREIETCKERSALIHGHLLRVSNWLQAELSQSNSEKNEKVAQLVKECEEYITHSDRIKKAIADDIADCRYKKSQDALSPMQVAAFLLGTPVAAAKFFEALVTNKPEAVTQAGRVGFAIGAYLAFHRQINRLCVVAGKALIDKPHRMKGINKKLRNASFALVLNTSVEATPRNDIHPRFHPQLLATQKVMVSARL